ncbi:MAG TPA: DNA polymerase III subunit delta [Bacillota bacterium]|jgi:DNA polymerase-3 subunit delta|nr:DNA polymerase III subunit delta [Bacillota bacterium]
MKPIYLFFGEEQFLIEEEVQKLITETLPAGRNAFNYQVYLAAESKGREVRGAVLTPAFGSGQKVVLVRHFHLWKKEDQEELLPLLDSWPPQSTLILWAEKIDQRTRVYQQIKKAGKVQEFPRLSGKDLSSWLRQHARTKYHLKLSAEVEAILLRLMGNDLRLLDQELAKLATYLGPENSQPTQKDLEVISWQADELDIFSLVDAIGKRQTKTALTFLERMLSEGAEPLGLLAMITRQMRNIFRIKALAGNRQRLRELGLHPYELKKCEQQAQGFRWQAREDIFKALFEADSALKRSQDANFVLEKLVLELCK